MNEFQATVVMLGLFVLRCIIPLALMAVIGYAMNRLVDHWEREDAVQRGAQKPESFPIPLAERTAAVTAMARKPAVNLPCWVFNNCDEVARSGCPAFKNQSLACWLARLRADGQLPAKCSDCPLYTGAPAGAARIGFSGD